jgi:pimeloyl-ACP methyl ester carboxylesterase
MVRRLIALLSVSLLVAGFAAPAGAEGTNTKEDVTIVSNADDHINIRATVFKPAGASADNPVPVLLHSHGWGGSRIATAGSFAAFMDAGMGVVSFDQRGHGATEGQANVEDPELEGKDVEAIVDYIADLDWVAHNLDADGVDIADDPVLGAMGGSYGGGYQLIGALTELRDHGRTRFDALAPTITWYDLPEALAPQGVVRTAWTTLLYAGAKSGGAEIPPWIDYALLYGAATGQWPTGTVPAAGANADVDKALNIDAEFHEHSPAAFVEDGIQLDIPMLVGQGATDTLFNMNQGLHNFQDTLTAAARAKSIFIGTNDGHEVGGYGPPVGELIPMATNPSGDKCSGGFQTLTINFYKAVFAGLNPRTETGFPAYNFSTNNGTCVRLSEIPSSTEYQVNPVGPVPGWGTPTGAGAPVNYELASGPLTVAGIPHLTGNMYASPDARAFFALSMGADMQSAKVIQSNVMPLHSFPAGLGDSIDIELPGIAAEIPAGQKLFLTITPISDIFFGHGRTPGVIAIEDLAVEVPVVGAN